MLEKKTGARMPLDEQMKDIEFTEQMKNHVMQRVQKQMPWYQREIRIHLPGALAVACIGIGFAFWFLGSPVPDHTQVAAPLVALDSGIFLESELRQWISGD